jgi:hypothetical protein
LRWDEQGSSNLRVSVPPWFKAAVADACLK